MQRESAEIFEEVEKKTGKKILEGGGLLYMKPIGHPDIQEFIKAGVKMSAEEINRRWPALNVPSYLEGVYCMSAGVAKVRHAIDGFKDVST